MDGFPLITELLSDFIEEDAEIFYLQAHMKAAWKQQLRIQFLGSCRLNNVNPAQRQLEIAISYN